MTRWVALLFVVVATAAAVLVTGERTRSPGDDARSAGEVSRSVVHRARNRTLNRLGAEDLVRNFRDQGNRNVRGTNVRCRAADPGKWRCSYDAGGKTCTGAVSGTPDEPVVDLFCGAPLQGRSSGSVSPRGDGGSSNAS